MTTDPTLPVPRSTRVPFADPAKERVFGQIEATIQARYALERPLREAQRRQDAPEVARLQQAMADADLRLRVLHGVRDTLWRAEREYSRQRIVASQAADLRYRRSVDRLDAMRLRSDVRLARAVDRWPPGLREARLESMVLELGDGSPTLRAHVETLCRTHGITLCAAVQSIRRGYAWPNAKRIEVPPVCSPWTYATALHEIGHVLHPCQSSHRPVPSKDRPKKTLCVRCELTVWSYAAQIALIWTAHDCHENLRNALGTYRQYATAAEAIEIDHLSSPAGYREIRLARATRSLEEFRS